MRLAWHLAPAACMAALLLTACENGTDGGGTSTVTPPASTSLGDPIPGLSTEELAAFERGRAVFSRRFKPSEGLGPLYNATSCESCHSSPVPGGSSKLYRNFYICMINPLGFQGPMLDLPSPIVPAFGSADWDGELLAHMTAQFTLEGKRIEMPDPAMSSGVVTIGQRNAIPIFGTGLFEFISDITIMSNADPDDLDGNGISGRYNTGNGALGRFGVKAQVNNIEIFTRAPLRNQLGITSDPLLGSGGTVSSSLAAFQGSTDPNEPTVDMDGVPDPEISPGDLGDLIAFTRFLAPPMPKPFTPGAQNGELTFDLIGCTACHIPSLPSSRGEVHAFTDILLHDMGPELADGLSFGLPQPALGSPLTTGDEFRTQPLWGVSGSGPYLHDGRANTLEEAILLHGGEGQTARDAYAALSAMERSEVIEFLEKL